MAAGSTSAGAPNEASQGEEAEPDDVSSTTSDPPVPALSIWQVPLILLLGVGAHATKLSLGPAEPGLKKAGLSPMAFALVSVVPALGQIVTPALWGSLHARRPRLDTWQLKGALDSVGLSIHFAPTVISLSHIVRLDVPKCSM